jgi:hypothetical protein
MRHGTGAAERNSLPLAVKDVSAMVVDDELLTIVTGVILGSSTMIRSLLAWCRFMLLLLVLLVVPRIMAAAVTLTCAR